MDLVYALAVAHNFLNRKGQVAEHGLDEEEDGGQDDTVVQANVVKVS